MARVKAATTLWNSLAVAGLILLALPFVIYAVERGLRFGMLDERVSSRLFDREAWTASAAIYLHMVSGAIVTVLAPIQLVRAIRTRWPKAHHITGYCVAFFAVLTAIAGLFYMSQKGTIGGWTMTTGFSLYGILMLLAAVQTIRYARKRHPLHELWAGRLIILALASWLYRVHYGLWEVLIDGAGSRPDFSGPFDVIQVFAFYLPYLAVHHLWWRARRRDN